MLKMLCVVPGQVQPGIGQWNYSELLGAFHALFYNNNKKCRDRGDWNETQDQDFDHLNTIVVTYFDYLYSNMF